MVLVFHTLEKEMATHSSIFAWRIPGNGEPDGLPSMGSPKAAKSDLDNEKLIFSNNVSVPLRQPAHRTFPYGKTKMSYTEALQCLC